METAHKPPCSHTVSEAWCGCLEGARAVAKSTRMSHVSHPLATTTSDVQKLGESTKPSNKAWSSSIKCSIFSNIVKLHTKATQSVWQVNTHVCPCFARRVPTICVLFSTLFQERVSYFAVYVLLLQHTAIRKHNMWINVLKPGSLAKAKKLVVNKAILNSI